MPRRSGPSIFIDGAFGDATYTGGANAGFGNRLTLGDITNNRGNIYLTEVSYLVEIVSKFEAIHIKSILSSLIDGLPFETTKWKTLSNNCKMNGINLGILKDNNLICNFSSDGSIWIGTDDGTLQEMRLGSTIPRECPPTIETPTICSTAQDLKLNLETINSKATTPVVSSTGTDSKFRTGNTYHTFLRRSKLNMDSTLTPGSSQNVVYATADLGDVTLLSWSLSAVNPTATQSDNIGINISPPSSLPASLSDKLESLIDDQNLQQELSNELPQLKSLLLNLQQELSQELKSLLLNLQQELSQKLPQLKSLLSNLPQELLQLKSLLDLIISDISSSTDIPEFIYGFQVGHNEGYQNCAYYYTTLGSYGESPLDYINLKNIPPPADNITSSVEKNGYYLGYWVGYNSYNLYIKSDGYLGRRSLLTELRSLLLDIVLDIIQL